MSALVTDQIRILNASNFVESRRKRRQRILHHRRSPNPTIVGYGRSNTWTNAPPAPIDSISNVAHTGDVVMFGKKITSANIRRLARKIDWVAGTRYEMYRDDYSV